MRGLSFFSCQQDMTGQSDPFVEVRRNILFIVFFEKKNCQPLFLWFRGPLILKSTIETEKEMKLFWMPRVSTWTHVDNQLTGEDWLSRKEFQIQGRRRNCFLKRKWMDFP